MLSKINEITKGSNIKEGKNDLYRKYWSLFDAILNPMGKRSIKGDNEILYVPNPDDEREFKAIHEQKRDMIKLFLGNTGMGKSTTLRHCFNITNNAIHIFEDKKEVVFPTFYDGYLVGSDSKDMEPIRNKIKYSLAQSLESVCSELEIMYPRLRTYFNTQDGQKTFFRFIRGTNPRVLEEAEYVTDGSLSVEEERAGRLKLVRKNEYFVYAATKLKMYLTNVFCPLEKLIIIADDIESLPFPYQAEIVEQYLRLHECMLNLPDIELPHCYYVNTIISMRPETYSLLRKILNEKWKIESYHIETIYKCSSASLYSIFEAKNKYLKRNGLIGREKSWEDGYKILMTLSSKFDSKYSCMIKNLVLHNLRDAQKIFAEVLCNRTWVQKDATKSGEFSISEPDFVFNNITVIRALACGQNRIYSNTEDNLLPNLLYNEREKDYSFINLLLLSFFYVKAPQLEDCFYGKTVFKRVCDLADIFKKVFPNREEIVEDVYWAICYLFKRNVLKKGIYDEERLEAIDEPALLGNRSLIYMSTKGYEMWDMLASDSVLMELFREDYYRNYDDPDNIKKTSFDLMKEDNQIGIFLDLFRMLKGLLKLERAYISYSSDADTITLYKENFGNSVITERLMNGIMNSVTYSGNRENKEIKEYYGFITESIAQLKKVLG